MEKILMKTEHIKVLATVCSYVAELEKDNYLEHIANGGDPEKHIYSSVIQATHILMNAQFDSL